MYKRKAPEWSWWTFWGALSSIVYDAFIVNFYDYRSHLTEARKHHVT